MRLLRPDLLTWWLVIPVLAASCGLHWRLRRAASPRDAAVFGASVVAAGAIVFALMRPQLLMAARVPEYERQDLIVMLDRSLSMRARDIAPSRSARATQELRNLVRHKPEGIDRIALVGFADSALVVSYLTADVESILFYLDWLDEDSSVLFGTNIGAALESAMEVAKKDDRPTRKRFLLVSDGEDYGAELNRALDASRAEGYRVDCIGIGSARTVPIPLTPPDGPPSYLTDDAGRRVTTTFDEATLVRVATMSGGRYVRSATGAELAGAIADVVKADRRVVGWRSSTEYRDVYPIALGVAAVAVAVLCVLI